MTGVELTADKPRRISARSDTLPPAAAAVSQSLEDERDKADLKTHTETVANGRHQYPLRVAGTVDGATTRDPVGYSNYSQAWENNLFLCMENTGKELVENPWVIVNGACNWRSVEAILEGILEEGMSEGEKARAIWEFARRHRYHATTADDEVKDTVKMLNVYGYTLCWDEAYTVSNLWQATGLKIRRGLPHGHCTTEVFFDGAYHLLDSDEHLLILERDNETIAGEEAISRDHDLAKRSHGYGVLSPESRKSNERAAALFCHWGPRQGTRPFIGDHQMQLNLRPGEALVWQWGNRGKYHGYGSAPPRFCNGLLRYAPELGIGFDRWVEEAVSLEPGPEGIGLRPLEGGRDSSITYRFHSPYVLVGGRLEARLSQGEGEESRAAAWIAEFSRDGVEWTTLAPPANPVPNRRGDREALAVFAADLDPCLPADSPACYSCLLRLRGPGLALGGLLFEFDLQMAPLSLPALVAGDNTMLYTDDCAGERTVEITHGWRERDDLPPPAPVLIAPVGGAEVAGTRPTFSWEPTPGAADYEFRLSPRPDLKLALSPVFEKLISRTPSKGRSVWSVPEEGLLNPDQTYYWQVRARNGDGLWSGWSRTASFQPRAPAVPAFLRLVCDWEARTIALHWRPGDGSCTLPHHYEVYGCDERGFTASRELYRVFEGGSEDETVEFPANLLGTAEATSMVVVGAVSCLGASGNRCFYRVVAVDETGERSGPSDYVEAPRPFIFSRPPVRIRAGVVTTYQLQVIRSIGDLRCISDGTSRYFAAFRDADELSFILDEGPPWVELEEATGAMRFSPQARDASTHTVTVRVQNGQGGVDVQGFDLEVTDG